MHSEWRGSSVFPGGEVGGSTRAEPPKRLHVSAAGHSPGRSEWPGTSWGQTSFPWFWWVTVLHGDMVCPLPCLIETSLPKPKLLSPGPGQFSRGRDVKGSSWLHWLSYITGQLGERDKGIDSVLEFVINFDPL